MVCNLNYIPNHLHTNDKPLIEQFYIGEKLFYRCKPENLKKPYDNISLYDISHNRDFNDNKTFTENDVFYNIIEDDVREKYENFNFNSFYIKNLSEGHHTYIKQFVFEDLTASITLKHSPVPCMYPHSVLEICIGNVVINNENYKIELGKKNQKFSTLRSLIRQELTSLIQTGFIDDSIQIEEITEL
ncbi:hypothetical protein [Flavobacterium yafengii]|uniref:hypothetical protein n=1 Tax=Flavobacterium yafengii TaxID=3041253 RepID=UPI0024A945BC|nr:hypothetical protein [Flavobacterium yafengii]MDI6045653.1 hypothetical protein [Flavobacterium yafengii]